jgi:hypothetical protein
MGVKPDQYIARRNSGPGMTSLGYTDWLSMTNNRHPCATHVYRMSAGVVDNHNFVPDTSRSCHDAVDGRSDYGRVLVSGGDHKGDAMVHRGDLQLTRNFGFRCNWRE